MKTTYTVFPLINTSGKTVGFGLDKLVDGSPDREFNRKAWDNPYTTREAALAARDYLMCAAKMTDLCTSMSANQRAVVSAMWLMDEAAICEAGKNQTDPALLYAARYIWFDRFGRFSRISAAKFYAKYVAGSSDSAPCDPGPASRSDSRGDDIPVCRDCGIEISAGGSGYCGSGHCGPHKMHRTEETNPLETCGRCGGSGIYRGGGSVINGVFVGYEGTCFRCKGKGTCTRRANELGEKGRGDYAARQFAGDIRSAQNRSRCECRFYSHGVEIDGPNGSDFSTSEGCPVHDPDARDDDDDYVARQQDAYDRQHFQGEPGYGNA